MKEIDRRYPVTSRSFVTALVFLLMLVTAGNFDRVDTLLDLEPCMDHYSFFPIDLISLSAIFVHIGMT